MSELLEDACTCGPSVAGRTVSGGALRRSHVPARSANVVRGPPERAREAASVPGIVEGVLEKVGDVTAIAGPARIGGGHESGDTPAELRRSGCLASHATAPAR